MFTPNICKVIVEDFVCPTDMFHFYSNNFLLKKWHFYINTYTASMKTTISNIWLGIKTDGLET